MIRFSAAIRMIAILTLTGLAFIFDVTAPAMATGAEHGLAAETAHPMTVQAQCGPGGPPGPWVALYRDINFGGTQLCFVGRGRIDLINYGFDFQASSINIGSNGYFIDGTGNTLGFWPGMRVADLRTMGWNDRIAQFQITG